MRDWLFDFNPHQPPKPDKTPPVPADASPSADEAAASRLQAALGDDLALLALARDKVPLAAKLAAIEALAGEEALKAAEREFRDHDRRVHRLAKQRYQRAVTQRESMARAAVLIDEARVLAQEPQIPLNRLVEIDRGWQALDAELLDAAQRSTYAALMAQLAALTRERADQPGRLKRWVEQAHKAQQDLQVITRQAAGGTADRAALAAAGAAARAVMDTAPAEAATGQPLEALARAADLALRLDERLVALERLLDPRRSRRKPAPADVEAAAPVAAEAESGAPVPADGEAVEAVAAEAADVGHAEEPSDAPDRLAPLGDAALDALLQQRIVDWHQGQAAAQAQRRTEQRERAKERQRTVKEHRTQSLAALLDEAEAALSSGQLGPTHGHLVEIDKLLDGGASAGPLRPRIDALQASYAQLKGWQHWAGGRARDELVQQAEELAAAAAAASEGKPVVGGVKLSSKQQGELIEEMRQRWKELDRLGGATSRSLWQRFDKALKVAYEPVARQVAALRTAREQNLQAREQLLAELEAVPLPSSDGGAPDADGDERAPAPDPRWLAGALDHFQVGWRKLGPVEHTVPHKARDAIVARMNAAVQRLEAPLQAARRGARQERERLVAHARALADEVAAGIPMRDLGDRARELQWHWQQQARALPLARGEENALWAEFKGAIDGAFSAREAAFQARESVYQAHGAERVALIERLEQLGDDLVPAALKRALAESDTQWQRTGPAPRADAAALENRYRKARDGVLRRIADSAQQAWQQTCDAVLARLALCDALEQTPDAAADKAALAERWAALPPVPEPLAQALAQRAGLAGAAAGSPLKTTTDELLLQLEAAWELASPAAFEAARRMLKLQAMKAALESRRSSAPVTPAQQLAELLRRPTLDATQRDRLQAVLAALRRRGSLDT
jgi:DNA repair protein SbcC/Rad50